MNQVVDLIYKSTNKSNNITHFNEAVSGDIDIKLSEDTLKNIIDSEDFIYNSLPNHHLSMKKLLSILNI